MELVLVRNNIIEFNIIVSLSSQHNPLFAQVSENYGQVFYFKSKQERQRELEARLAKKDKENYTAADHRYIMHLRYWFTCECPACKEDWPLLKENKKVKIFRLQ